jgi:predicted HTH transcriptional regulator
MATPKKAGRSAMKLLFYTTAVGVGTLLAVSALKKKGHIVKKGTQKLVKKTKTALKVTTDNLNKRQKQILALFDREEQITIDMITTVIRNVTRRTIRRDLDHLEKKGYIKQVGKTKGSYYVLR